MKKLSRILSVGLSLAMCAGMVMPAFAAQILDEDNKNTFIGADGALLAHDGNGGAAAADAETKYYDYKLGSDIELDRTLVIGAGVAASIDLNGHDLMLNDTVEAKDDQFGYLSSVTVSNSQGDTKQGSVIKVESKAELTIDDSTAEYDDEGNQTYAGSGKITGGTGSAESAGSIYTKGGGIYNKGTVTLNGGAITGNIAYSAGGISNKEGSTFTMNGGAITGNDVNLYGYGGGVYNEGMFNAPNTFNMNGGTISGNKARNGGGVYDAQYVTFTMNGGAITGNTAYSGDGGGVYNYYGTFNMDGGTISGNKASRGGGVFNFRGPFNMTDGAISDNTSLSAGGVYNSGGAAAKFTMTGGIISGNTAKYGGGIYNYYESVGGGGTFTMNGGTITNDNMEGDDPVAVAYYKDGVLLGKVKVKTATGEEVEVPVRWVYEKIDDIKEYVPGEGGKVSETYVYIRPALMDEDGNIIIDAGNSAIDKDGEKIDLPNGGIIDTDHNVIGTTVDPNEDGTVTVTTTTTPTENSTDEGKTVATVVKLPEGGETETDAYSNTKLPEGSKVIGEDEKTYPDGATIDKDGNVTGHIVTKTDNGKDEQGKDTVTIKTDNGKDGDENKQTETEITLPDGKDSSDVTVDDQGNTTIPEGSKVKDKDGNEIDLPYGGTIDKDGNVMPNDAPETGSNTGNGGGFTSTETEIDDVAVPLAAGPVTRAEFIDYLWRHEGEPETDGVYTFTDVPADHEFILALAWAEQTGVAKAYFDADGHEDGTFEPDELVTVAAVREFLGNFARVFEMDVDVYALFTLTGEDDEAVLNCDEVLAEFFSEELAAAA